MNMLANKATQGASYAIFVLTMMNLLNYIDRYVPSVVKDLFKHDLKLTDFETSLPITGFVLVYMISSVIFGALADRFPRKYLIAAGVVIWSVATALAAFATGFWTFMLARALVGVGEAAYATLAPALLSDFFPPERRNRILTIFYVAIPIGSAMGFILGGYFGQMYGWRAAFLICGLPGILMALLALWIRDPGRGRYDHDADVTPPKWAEAIGLLLRNREYVLVVAGYTFVTFAAGALADWFPTFLQRNRGMSIEASGHYVGMSAVFGGLLGTIIGGYLADYLKKYTRQSYMAISGWSMLLATIFGFFALTLHDPMSAVIMLFFAQFFLWFYNGPVNAMLANCVPSSLRVRAFALTILLIHLLGDAISPSIVGLASDHIGLQLALQLVPIAMGIGAMIWLYTWRKLPERVDV
jgi:MFS family permease